MLNRPSIIRTSPAGMRQALAPSVASGPVKNVVQHGRALELAMARQRAGDDLGALSAAARACALLPGEPRSVALRVRLLARLDRHEAVVKVLQDEPAHAVNLEAWSHLGDAHRRLGRPAEALSAYMNALAADPRDGTLHYRLGLCFDDMQLREQAVQCFRTALMLDLGPLEVGVRDMLIFHDRQFCHWHEADSRVDLLRRSARALPEDAAVRTNPFAHATLLDDPQDLLRAARATARFFAASVQPLPPRKPSRGGRLRVGYVSCDFHHHATSLLMIQLIERHDRANFEITLYSHGRRDDSPVHARLVAASDHFVDIDALSDRDAAQRIRRDGIDILVDLKGYTRGGRPGLFAWRPAAVQVAYLGFPGTTGASCIDYIVGDTWVTPLANAADFSEQIAQLPGAYQCNDGTRPLPQRSLRSAHGLPESAVVLCGFTQPYKISPEVFEVWCRLIAALPDAVLWLLDDNATATISLRREAQAGGIDARRLVFAPKMAHDAHLDRLGCADLFLDTWPCNGHTTVSDALWAGLPVVTWSGRTFASRVAGSLLRTLGFPELVCAGVADYEAMALDLGQDAQRRSLLRHEIEASRLTTPLFDGALKARQLESLYRRMWDRARLGQAPAHLPVQGPDNACSDMPVAAPQSV
jgi:predicted O-linked N-acetylglucosamine transferase (SPINDLY family)